jgi:hypothetical protein
LNLFDKIAFHCKIYTKESIGSCDCSPTSETYNLRAVSLQYSHQSRIFIYVRTTKLEVNMPSMKRQNKLCNLIMESCKLVGSLLAPVVLVLVIVFKLQRRL